MSGHNTSSTTILVSWDEVPADQQNGIITGYAITYQSQTENHNGSVSAGPSDRQKNITGLMEYVDYNITVFASTVKGDGPHSSPVLVIRTNQDSKCFITMFPVIQKLIDQFNEFIFKQRVFKIIFFEISVKACIRMHDEYKNVVWYFTPRFSN